MTTIVEPKTLEEMFYTDRLMPCCGNPKNFLSGPKGGNSTTIECFHCGQTWNICPPIFIEKI